MLIGVISDTHGYLPWEALDAFSGCDTIIHAGDIGNMYVLLSLREVASVIAVLGNCDDQSTFAWDLESRCEPLLGGVRFIVTHRPRDIGEVAADVSVVISGHTHRRRDEWVDGVRYINPGSATEPREVDQKRSVALLSVEDAYLSEVRFILF